MAAKSAVVAPNSNARTLLIGIAVLMGVCIASLIIAGATSLISLAERIHPVAGTIAFWGICLAAGLFALYCLIAYARLPAALVPPKETSGPKHEAYLRALRVRLANNPRARKLPLATTAEIEIPWIIAGPGVAGGKEIRKPVNTYDTAVTIAYIFGLQPPECWIGKPVTDAFKISR